MKTSFFCIIGSFVFFVMFLSCVSLTDRTMSFDGSEAIVITGPVKTTFTTYQFLHIIGEKHETMIMEKAYTELLAEAQNKYGAGIDVINIVIEGTYSGHNFWFLPLYGAPLILQNFQKITATGDVIYLAPLQRAIKNTSDAVISKLPAESKIVVLNFESWDKNIAIMVTDELEHIFVTSGNFTIVDRYTFSTGKMTEANIIISGSVTDADSFKRLEMRAFDAQTGQMVTMAREDFLTNTLKSNVNSLNFQEHSRVNGSNTTGNQRNSQRQSRETGSVPQLGVPTIIQQGLNRLPAVPIGGKNLKFEFGGDVWIAKVNGQNFLAGNCIFEETGDGYILTLTTNNVWSGAVEEVIDLLQNIGVPLGPAAGPLKTAARLAARFAKWIPLKESSIVLEYNEGPPASLRFNSR